MLPSLCVCLHQSESHTIRTECLLVTDKRHTDYRNTSSLCYDRVSDAPCLAHSAHTVLSLGQLTLILLHSVLYCVTHYTSILLYQAKASLDPLEYHAEQHEEENPYLQHKEHATEEAQKEHEKRQCADRQSFCQSDNYSHEDTVRLAIVDQGMQR